MARCAIFKRCYRYHDADHEHDGNNKHDGDTIIASLESEMTVKQLHLTPPPVRLLPRNSAYQPITVEGDMVMEVFGVVTNVIRSMKRGR